ncbi:hypothetical protein GCM10010140_40980 [Streptosporangium pseudovulgare]|uniref:Uncharacterized protein n=1 Tax=Streptosporangium pseudovulgare TaxID=35765 RepID=A0ABQ2QZZ6_9ACTN|nr:hypothetical protein GCM10010140_40980 [Streptosporangium pseudovulgare]
MLTPTGRTHIAHGGLGLGRPDALGDGTRRARREGRRWTLPHTEAGITSTLWHLTGYGDPAELRVAIETSKGLVVDRLLAAGHPIVPIHPGMFTAMRPRWGTS